MQVISLPLLLFLLCWQCNIYSFCQNTLRYGNEMHYCKIQMSIVKRASKERVLNSSPKWVSASTIKTVKSKARLCCLWKLLIPRTRPFTSLNKNSFFLLLWKMLPLEQCFIYRTRLHKREWTITSWSWHAYFEFSNSLNQLTLQPFENT